MDEKDIYKRDYDIQKLKSNLNRLMSEKGLTQEKFGDLVGVGQSRMCNILNSQKNDCVTVTQLASIALAFHVSVDDLLGISPEKESGEAPKAVTTAAIFEKLFEIDDMEPLHICELPREAETAQEIYAVYFANENLCRYLMQWGEVKSINISYLLKKRTEQLWKEDLLGSTSASKREWDYRDRSQQEAHLASLLIDFYRKERFLPAPAAVPPDDLLNRENFEMLGGVEPDDDVFEFLDDGEFYAALEWLAENFTIIDS